MKPKDQWPDSRLSKAESAAKVEKVLEDIPGSAFEISPPIQMRFNELSPSIQPMCWIAIGLVCTVATGFGPRRDLS